MITFLHFRRSIFLPGIIFLQPEKLFTISHRSNQLAKKILVYLKNLYFIFISEIYLLNVKFWIIDFSFKPFKDLVSMVSQEIHGCKEHILRSVMCHFSLAASMDFSALGFFSSIMMYLGKIFFEFILSGIQCSS